MRRPGRDIDADLGDLIRFGTISEVDLDAARCVVAVGEVRTGPIRWVSLRAGDTRTWSPPSIGESVLLICPEGDLAAAVALPGLSCNAFPPAGNSLRELIAFRDGSVIAYDREAHTFELLLVDGATARIRAPGGLAIEGDVAISGKLDVADSIAAEGDVTGAGISLKDHRHAGVQPGSGQSGKPL
jgi:phage baseplate assembly protein V